MTRTWRPARGRRPQTESTRRPTPQWRGRGVSGARLRGVLDSLGEGVIVADTSGRLLFCNPAAERLLGANGLALASSGQWPALEGCFRADGFTPCAAEDLPLARAQRGESVSGARLLVRNEAHPEGLWLSLDASPLLDGRGHAHGCVMVFRDVTARERQTQQLQLLSNVVEQTADCVLVTDAEGHIEYVNPGFERITGYSFDEAVGRTPAILKSGEHGADFYAQLWRTLDTGDVFRGTLVNRRKDGVLFYCEQTITPLRDGGGRISHLVSVGKDVTGLRRAAQRESGFQLARRVQQKLYPETPPCVPGLDICGRALVADMTGGDYYDFLELEGGFVGIAIGDVSGHGMDSALVMAEMRAVLRATARTVADPGEVLAVVNRALVEDTDENRFATLLLAVVEREGRRIRYASAGQPPGYVLDRRGRVCAELGATGPPLGLFADAEFPTRDGISLGPGDTLVLVTDGVTESESPASEPFGFARVLDVVRAHAGQPCAAVVDALAAEVRAFTSPSAPQDDITIVVCAANE